MYFFWRSDLSFSGRSFAALGVRHRSLGKMPNTEKWKSDQTTGFHRPDDIQEKVRMHLSIATGVYSDRNFRLLASVAPDDMQADGTNPVQLHMGCAIAFCGVLCIARKAREMMQPVSTVSTSFQILAITTLEIVSSPKVPFGVAAELNGMRRAIMS
ncbi:hypothetical protein BDW42DRAFT_88472 [Aspergillus taichungensis]|uniref:Uncharacterized protein n=1 Tax=Aspergillus taichungensis TaxID=482145 RepID=A0A2J5HWQ8_9EURO|nr:hypothetical protein BDW42DRAFT_88472 [Aspergillus taichungensis]